MHNTYCWYYIFCDVQKRLRERKKIENKRSSKIVLCDISLVVDCIPETKNGPCIFHDI